MSNKKTPPPFTADTLPGELPDFQAQERSGDESMFVAFEAPGDTFTGLFVKSVPKGTNGLEYEASIFLEYPSGDLRLLPYGWSLGNEIAKQEEKGRNLLESVMQVTLEKVKKTDEGTRKEKTVKLFRYAYMTLTMEQAAAFHAKAKGPEQWMDLIGA